MSHDPETHSSRPNRSRGPWLLLLLLVGVLAAGVGGQRAARSLPPPQRLALLVGVSRYPVVPTKVPWTTLHTHDELQALRKALVETHGFADKDVMVLEDEKASRRAIRDAVQKHLIAQAKQGSVVFFHFSGHGQQIEDKNGDEIDRLDESIVPGDATDQSEAAGAVTNILDDEIAGWLRTLGERMRGTSGKVEGSIVLSFDSCFSGTLSRGGLIERGRDWDPALDGRPKPAPLSEEERSQRKMLPGNATLDLPPSDYVLLSAARSDQTAKERNGMGIYTRALVGALTRLGRGVTYRTLMDDIAVEMRREVSNQNAELEGDENRTVFGAPAGKPARLYLPVLRVSGDQVEVPAGDLHLVTKGSVYALHRAGGAPMDKHTLLGLAEVQQVYPTTSWLKLREGTRIADNLLRAARIIEQEHVYPECPLSLRCEESTPGGADCQHPALREALAPLQASHVIELKKAVDAACGQELRLVPTRGALDLYRPESKDPFASIPRTNPAPGLGEEVLRSLTDRLRAEWRWRRLFALHGQSPSVQVGLRLVPADAPRDARGLAQAQPKAHQEQASASLRMPEGSLFQLEINNPTAQALFVTVLELGPHGSISVLFPAEQTPGDARIMPGTVIPAQYLFAAATPKGGWTLKAIATREPADFRPLVQEAASRVMQGLQTRGNRRQSRATSHPLGALIAEAVSGRLDRSNVVGVPMGTWAIANALLEVIDRPATETATGSK